MQGEEEEEEGFSGTKAVNEEDPERGGGGRVQWLRANPANTSSRLAAKEVRGEGEGGGGGGGVLLTAYNK